MSQRRQLVGKTGEERAKEFLLQQGYAIVETNYRCALGEIDIVALDGDTTVLVEVRTKTSLAYGSPEESITAAKARRLRRMAQSYLQSQRRSGNACRIDLVAVILDRETHEVLSIKQIKGILAG
jgi:putative endonuclease